MTTDMYEVDGVSGGHPLVGSTGVGRITGLDVNASGVGYAVDFDCDFAMLYDVDVVAGTVTARIPPSYSDESPVAGVFTPLVTDGTRVAALAVDPDTGILYGFSCDGIVLSYEGGVETTVGNLDPAVWYNSIVWAADFEPMGGVLWVVAQGHEETLAALDGSSLLGWTLRVVSLITADSDFVENLTVFQAPTPDPTEETLPDTGAEAAPLLGAGIVALIGGLVILVILVLQVRLRRRVTS